MGSKKAADQQVAQSPEVNEAEQAIDAPVVPVVMLHEKYKVKVKHKFRIDEETGATEKYIAEIIKGEKLGETLIEERQAKTLNDQVENSGIYYFLAQ